MNLIFLNQNGNGNRVQIRRIKLHGDWNHVIAAHFSWNKNSTTYLGEVQTIRQTSLKQDAGMVGRSKQTPSREGRRLKMLSRLGRVKTTSELSFESSAFLVRICHKKTVRRRLHICRWHIQPFAKKKTSWLIPKPAEPHPSDSWLTWMMLEKKEWSMNPDEMRFWIRRNVSVMVWGCILIHGFEIKISTSILTLTPWM